MFDYQIPVSENEVEAFIQKQLNDYKQSLSS